MFRPCLSDNTVLRIVLITGNRAQCLAVCDSFSGMEKEVLNGNIQTISNGEANLIGIRIIIDKNNCLYWLCNPYTLMPKNGDENKEKKWNTAQSMFRRCVLQETNEEHYWGASKIYRSLPYNGVAFVFSEARTRRKVENPLYLDSWESDFWFVFIPLCWLKLRFLRDCLIINSEYNPRENSECGDCYFFLLLAKENIFTVEKLDAPKD